MENEGNLQCVICTTICRCVPTMYSGGRPTEVGCTHHRLVGTKPMSRCGSCELYREGGVTLDGWTHVCGGDWDEFTCASKLQSALSSARDEIVKLKSRYHRLESMTNPQEKIGVHLPESKIKPKEMRIDDRGMAYWV